MPAVYGRVVVVFVNTRVVQGKRMKYLVQEDGRASGIKTALTGGMLLVFVKLAGSGMTLTYEVGEAVAWTYSSPPFDYTGASMFIGALIAGVLGRKWVTTNGK